MSKTNHRPLVNSKKIEKLEAEIKRLQKVNDEFKASAPDVEIAIPKDAQKVIEALEKLEKLFGEKRDVIINAILENPGLQVLLKERLVVTPLSADQALEADLSNHKKKGS